MEDPITKTAPNPHYITSTITISSLTDQGMAGRQFASDAMSAALAALAPFEGSGGDKPFLVIERRDGFVQASGQAPPAPVMEALLGKLDAAVGAARAGGKALASATAAFVRDEDAIAAAKAVARSVPPMADFLLALDEAFPVLPDGFDQFVHEVTLGEPRSPRDVQLRQLEAAATALGMVIRRPPDDAWVVCAQCGGRRSDEEGACLSCDAEVTECESWGPKLAAPRGPAADVVPLATAEATVVLGHVVRSGVAGFIDAIRRPVERTGPSAVDRAAYETAKRVELLVEAFDDDPQANIVATNEICDGAVELAKYVTGYVDTRLPASVADPFWFCASCGDIERARVDTAIGATSACKCNAQRTAVKRAEATIAAAAALRAAGGIDVERLGANDRAAGVADYIAGRAEALTGVGWAAMGDARRATQIALVTRFLDQLGVPPPAWLNVALHYEGSTCTAIAGGVHGLFDGDRLEVLLHPDRVFDVAVALFGAGVAALARAARP